MHTRREIIKSGAGLAAIIAAGKAPAAIVRSMMGARNAMLAGGGGEELKYDWLESDGVAYVTLPFKIGCDLKIVCDFMRLENAVGYIFGGYHSWGQSSPPTRYNLSLYCNTPNLKFELYYGQPKATKDFSFVPSGTRRFSLTIDAPNSSFEQNGNMSSYTDSTTDANRIPHNSCSIPFNLFSTSTGATGSNYRPMKMRLYSFSVRSYGQLLFEFEPRVIDGKSVVFDRVSQTALQTLGGGTFTAGNG